MSFLIHGSKVANVIKMLTQQHLNIVRFCVFSSIANGSTVLLSLSVLLTLAILLCFT